MEEEEVRNGYKGGEDGDGRREGKRGGREARKEETGRERKSEEKGVGDERMGGEGVTKRWAKVSHDLTQFRNRKK